jgi:hypothetical protein
MGKNSDRITLREENTSYNTNIIDEEKHNEEVAEALDLNDLDKAEE